METGSKGIFRRLSWKIPAGCLFLAASFAFVIFRDAPEYTVYYGQNSTAGEKAVCEDLKHDIEDLTGTEVELQEEPEQFTGKGYHILVGTPSDSRKIAEYRAGGKIVLEENAPGPRGGRIEVIRDGKSTVLVIAGYDTEGLQNAIYDFSEKDLGIDPLAYWTGYRPAMKKDFNPYGTATRMVSPSAIPVVCYFENDVDELANMKKPYLEYDMPTWKGMINTLRRLHYNAIHIFDMFGRAEFYTREGYRKIRPDYRVNLPLIDSMIDYAHLKGMKVQVDLSLGYQMKSITGEQALCWTTYRKQWIDTWVYYLTSTPLKKADIFSMRPRNQVWDRAYVSSCGEDKAQVFNEAFASLDSILNIYKPGALKICVCYDDGMELFNDGFNPPRDFIIAWSDDGYCHFKYLPLSNKGYAFGTYMHAGYWKNHTVHDPYPDRIDSVMTQMLKRYDAGSYLQVNGQTFRPFLLNLEAFSRFAADPAGFDGERFYREWCIRYYGEPASVFAVNSMKALGEAQYGRSGYVQFLGEIKNFFGYLADTLVIGPSGSHTAHFQNLPTAELSRRLEYSREALKQAGEGLKAAEDQHHFYFDYIYLPALMLDQLLEFENTLEKLAELKAGVSSAPQNEKVDYKPLLDQASEQLNAIWKTAEEGDRYTKWAGWYDPVKRRPNNGFPTSLMLQDVRRHLLSRGS